MQPHLSEAELARQIAQYAGLSPDEARDFIAVLGDVLSAELLQRGRARLPGLGSFRITVIRAHEGRDPNTGAAVHVPEQHRVVFHPQRDVASLVNFRHSQEKARTVRDGMAGEGRDSGASVSEARDGVATSPPHAAVRDLAHTLVDDVTADSFDARSRTDARVGAAGVKGEGEDAAAAAALRTGVASPRATAAPRIIAAGFVIVVIGLFAGLSLLSSGESVAPEAASRAALPASAVAMRSSLPEPALREPAPAEPAPPEPAPPEPAPPEPAPPEPAPPEPAPPEPAPPEPAPPEPAPPVTLATVAADAALPPPGPAAAPPARTPPPAFVDAALRPSATAVVARAGSASGAGAALPLSPAPAAAPSRGPSELARPALAAVHRVTLGETLSTVATDHYGQDALWPMLLAANRLEHPDRLEVGTELAVPPLVVGPARLTDSEVRLMRDGCLAAAAAYEDDNQRAAAFYRRLARRYAVDR